MPVRKPTGDRGFPVNIREAIVARWKERGVDLKNLGLHGMASIGLQVVEPSRKAAMSGNQPEVVAIANTAAVDLDDEVVVPSGADPALFEKYGAIYYNHISYGDMLPVGTLRQAALINGGSAWRIRFAVASNPFAQDVLTAIREGVVRGVSIGFVRTEWGDPTAEELDEYGPHQSITRGWRWLETSVVPMPCNPDAIIDGMTMPDEAARSLEELVRKGRIGQKSAAMMGLPKRRKSIVFVE